MSKEAVLAFFVKSRTDEDIQQKFYGLGLQAPSDGVIKLGKESGYEFSESDLIAVIKGQVEAGISPNEELSEADLESVAGGVQKPGETPPNRPTQNTVIKFPRCIGTEQIPG